MCSQPILILLTSPLPSSHRRPHSAWRLASRRQPTAHAAPLPSFHLLPLIPHLLPSPLLSLLSPVAGRSTRGQPAAAGARPRACVGARCGTSTRGSSTTAIAGARLRPAQELGAAATAAAGARAVPRRPFPFPLCSFPLLAPMLAPLRPFLLLALALLPYKSAAAAGTASSRRAWRRRERRARRRREQRDPAQCRANRPL